MNANEWIQQAEQDLKEVFTAADQTEYALQERVLRAFADNRVSARHFAPTEGYGYDDIGRDCLDKVFAAAMGAESALVRPQIANGTHAIYLALRAVLRPGDKILSITGAPYDTLETAVGICGDAENSLKKFGISFESIPSFDPNTLAEKLADPALRMIYVQRSRGYTARKAISAEEMGEWFAFIKNLRPDICIFVDNCYGEFTELIEPCAVGADLIAGSLIKNPGGGLAPTGGYVAGSARYVEQVADCQTVPGCGREIGSYAAGYRPFYQGLFMAPHTVCQALKTAMLFARVFELMGLPSSPCAFEKRADIIQSVSFETKEQLVAFCAAIQAAAPIDSFVHPEPWAMPGYADPVIMAAGAFVQGATTELSCDAPLRAPYTAYLQGALTYAHGRLAAKKVLEELFDR